MEATTTSELQITPDEGYYDLKQRIDDLSHSTEKYKTQVLIAGCVVVGVIILLIIAIIWIFVQLCKIRSEYRKKAMAIDPLDKRFTIARPHLRNGSENSTPTSTTRNGKTNNLNKQNRNTYS